MGALVALGLRAAARCGRCRGLVLGSGFGFCRLVVVRRSCLVCLVVAVVVFWFGLFCLGRFVLGVGLACAAGAWCGGGLASVWVRFGWLSSLVLACFVWAALCLAWALLVRRALGVAAGCARFGFGLVCRRRVVVAVLLRCPVRCAVAAVSSAPWAGGFFSFPSSLSLLACRRLALACRPSSVPCPASVSISLSHLAAFLYAFLLFSHRAWSQ